MGKRLGFDWRSIRLGRAGGHQRLRFWFFVWVWLGFWFRVRGRVWEGS